MSARSKKKHEFLNRELLGMSLTLIGAFLLFCLIFPSALYPFSDAVNKFLLGLNGYFAYPLAIFSVALGIMKIFGIKSVRGRALVTAIAFVAMFSFCFCLVHLAFRPISGKSFYEYVEECYNAAENGISGCTAGGAVCAIFVYAMAGIFTEPGSYALYALLIILASVVALRDRLFKRKTEKREDRNEDKDEDKDEDKPERRRERGDIEEPDLRRRGDNTYSRPSSERRGGRRILASGPFELKDGNDEEENERGEDANRTDRQRTERPSVYSEEYERDFSEKLDYVKSSRRINPDDLGKTVETTMFSTVGERTPRDTGVVDEPDFEEEIYIPENYRQAMRENRQDKSDDEPFLAEDEPFSAEPEHVDGVDESASDDNIVDMSNADFGFDKSEKGRVEEFEEDFDEPIKPRRTESLKPEVGDEEDDFENTVGDKEGDKKVNPYDEMPLNFKYNPPPLNLLRVYESSENYGEVEVFKREKAAKILNTLKFLNNIDAQVVNIIHGPTITRFDLAIPENISVKNVVKYTDDLKLRLETKSEIRFTTVPGTPYVGVEVPNDKQATVGLRAVLESEKFINAKQNTLTFAIGEDIIGNPVVADITKMPHLLIAGATGTGKSVGLNALLVSLMYKYSPAELRFIIIDPKQVEFTMFSGIPHMLFDEIIYEPQKAIAALAWAVKEMESRYSLLREAMVRNIDEYNTQIDPNRQRKMPRIVMIVDEFADLMSVDKKGIEEKIARIAQKARAAGIYLVLATQRPSVNIMEGSIKTNFTSRMAFKMSNAIDSNTILNEVGAEKLLGRGDLLYRMSDMTSVERAQGAFIDGEEIKNVVAYLKANNKCYFNEAALADINGECSPQIENVTARSGGSRGGAVSPDNLAALYLAVQRGSISISMLQRALHFGFPKAGAIVDWMSREGYLAAGAAGKQKPVTLTKEQFDEKYGDVFTDEDFNERYGGIV